MNNKLRLENGCIKIDGFETLRNKKAFLIIYPAGITICERVLNKKNFYHEIVFDGDNLTGDNLYEVLTEYGKSEIKFVYIAHADTYYETK